MSAVGSASASSAIRRHCMVVHAYYPIGETRVQREALALVDRGYEVEVVCLRAPGEPPRSTHDGVIVRRLPVRRHRDRGLAVQLAEYLAFFAMAGAVVSARHLRAPFGAVQVHNLPDFLVFCALVPKLTGASILLDLHDLMPEFFASRTGGDGEHGLVRVVRWQERLACRFADHVITVTDGWRDTLIARGVPPDKVSVVMNVADARLFHRTTGARDGGARDGAVHNGDGGTRTGDGGAGPHLLYHGTFTRRYGVDLAIEALAEVRHDLPDVHLTLVGDGDLRPDLVAARDRLGLRDRVTISDGMVDAADLPGLIATADAGLVPTRSDTFTDGLLPTKLMELVAMGTPVIAARTPTVAAYFRDDMVAFFPPGDSAALAATIRALAADPGRLQALADNAEAFNRAHDWDATADAYAGVVARAARRGTTASARVRASAAPDDPAWDAFLAGLPGGHHTQTSLWAQVKAALGWRAARVIADRDGRIVGGAQILYRALPGLGAVGYVSRGPVLAAPDDALAALLLDAVERAARDLGIRHLTIQPAGSGEDAPAYLAGRRYLPSATEVAPRATVLLDVTAGPDALLAGMSARTRYNVRLGGRRSLVVREGGADDVATFHRLLEATARRQGFRAPPLAYYMAMWRVLAPRGHLRLAFAELDGEPLSGQVAVVFGDTVVNKLSVWSGREGSRRPNEALQWATIRWAHDHGHRTYDLEGLQLAAARAVARGAPLPASAAQSVTSYKLGFGGSVVLMPGAQVHVPNPLLRWGVAQVYPRVAGRPAVKRAVKRLRTGAAQAQRRAPARKAV